MVVTQYFYTRTEKIKEGVQKVTQANRITLKTLSNKNGKFTRKESNPINLLQSVDIKEE